MTFAESIIRFKHANPTPAELNAILGDRWAICRNTPKNQERWGKCITQRQYNEAVELALDSRLMDGAGI